MRKMLRILLILVISQALLLWAQSRCAAVESDAPLVFTALRPMDSQDTWLLAPFPTDGIELPNAAPSASDEVLQDGQWKLPEPDPLFDEWAEDVYPGPRLPQLPELEELPPVKVVPPPKIWSYRFEFGVNGAEGNSRFFNTRTGVKIKRKTKKHSLTIDWYHALALNKSERSQNDSVVEWRWETAIKDSDWSTFLHNTNEYDEFTGWDIRVQGDGGVSYWFLRSDTTKLQGRTGAGVSREFGGDNSDSIPEASAGFDFDHRLTPKQKLDAKLDVFPDVRDLNDFRARMNGGWEIQIDEADHLTLRFSVQDKYDSTPDKNKRPNDFTYAAQLIWDY